MSLTDHYGFDLSTDTTEAATAYDHGARSFVAWRADAMGYLDAAIAAALFRFNVVGPAAPSLRRGNVGA